MTTIPQHPRLTITVEQVSADVFKVTDDWGPRTMARADVDAAIEGRRTAFARDGHTIAVEGWPVTDDPAPAPHAFAKGQAVRYRDEGRPTDQAATVIGLRGHNQFGDPCYLLRLDEGAEAVDVPTRGNVKGFTRPALTAGQEIGAYEGALKAAPPVGWKVENDGPRFRPYYVRRPDGMADASEFFLYDDAVAYAVTLASAPPTPPTPPELCAFNPITHAPIAGQPAAIVYDATGYLARYPFDSAHVPGDAMLAARLWRDKNAPAAFVGHFTGRMVPVFEGAAS